MTIPNPQADVLRACQQSREAFDRALASLRKAVAAIHAAQATQDEALDHVIAANKAALARFNRAQP